MGYYPGACARLAYNLQLSAQSFDPLPHTLQSQTFSFPGGRIESVTIVGDSEYHLILNPNQLNFN
jgi:hypothetical protein